VGVVDEGGSNGEGSELAASQKAEGLGRLGRVSRRAGLFLRKTKKSLHWPGFRVGPYLVMATKQSSLPAHQHWGHVRDGNKAI
jgi:hypothetical protein